jgi:hypothetical protein
MAALYALYLAVRELTRFAIKVCGSSPRGPAYLVGAKRWRLRRDLNSEPNGSKPFARSN